MLLLAFETSAKVASVALFRDDTLLGEQYQNTGLTHSQTLLVMAQELLQQCDLTPAQVEAVAEADLTSSRLPRFQSPDLRPK